LNRNNHLAFISFGAGSERLGLAFGLANGIEMSRLAA
jgi:hypothetical protein